MKELTDYKIGKLWNDSEVDIIEWQNSYFALNGWNGKSWTNCWAVKDKDGRGASDNMKFTVTPVYDREMSLTGFKAGS